MNKSPEEEAQRTVPEKASGCGVNASCLSDKDAIPSWSSS